VAHWPKDLTAPPASPLVGPLAHHSNNIGRPWETTPTTPMTTAAACSAKRTNEKGTAGKSSGVSVNGRSSIRTTAAIATALASANPGDGRRDRALGPGPGLARETTTTTAIVLETDTDADVTKSIRKRAAAAATAAVEAAAAVEARRAPADPDPENVVVVVKRTRRNTITAREIERSDITNGITARRARSTRGNPTAATTANGRGIAAAATDATTIPRLTLPPPSRTQNAKSSKGARNLAAPSHPSAEEVALPTSESTASSTPPTSTPTPGSNRPSSGGSPESRAFRPLTGRSTS